MKSFLKSTLAAAGLQVRRVPRRPHVAALPPQTARRDGKIIEFLGPSACGKSYMMCNLQQSLPSGWLYYRPVASDQLILPREPEEEIACFYRTLHMEKARRWARGEFPHKQVRHQITAMRFSLSVIENNLALDMRPDLSVINDESLVSNYWAEVLLLAERQPDIIRKMLKRRYVVMLHASKQRMLRNLEQRRTEVPDGAGSFVGYTEDEMIAYAEAYYAKMPAMYEMLQEFAAAVVRLDENECEKVEASCEKIVHTLTRQSVSA